MQSVDARSPELWRKPTNQSASDQATLTEQKPFVDTLHQTREKKWFFDTVDTQDDQYFPYGAPGNGAPLRNPETNEVVSKLPHIEENLWKNPPGSRNGQSQSPTKFLSQSQANLETINKNKRQEIHQFIDEITKPKQNLNDFNYQPYDQNYYISRPKKVKNVDPSHYWNDWFGRPGAGAPNWDTRKQNLDQMLEPKQMTSNRAIYVPTVYDSTAALSTPRRKYRSDHHNHYEMAPR